MKYKIPKWPGYRVDKKGDIWSRRNNHGGLDSEYRKLVGKTDKRGYRHVILSVKGKRRYAKVAQLVMEAIKGPCPKGFQVRHLNDIKGDDRYKNLCYGTGADNSEDARKNGKLRIGEKHGMSILTNKLVRKLRNLRQDGLSYSHIGQITGINRSTVYAAVSGRNWRHVK